MIEEAIKEHDKTWEKNWTLNLSAFIVDGDKGKALESLDELKKDIKTLREKVKKIEIDKSLHKDQKKDVKRIKKILDKTLSLYLNQVYKISKHIDKDKEIKSTVKYDKKINKSQKQIIKANEHYSNLLESLELEAKLIEIAETELIDKDSAEEILKAEELRIEKEKAKKAEREAKEKKKKEKEEVEKEKSLEKKREEFNKQIDEYIEMGQGVIVDIKPNGHDDWEVAYVYVDNSWYDLNEGDKLSFAESVGPVIESLVIEYGMNDYSTVYIVDENKTILAKPKLLGGYKIKK